MVAVESHRADSRGNCQRSPASFSHRSRSQRTEDEGKIPIRSHVIEASGSSEAWCVPPRPFPRCGLAGRAFSASSGSIQCSFYFV